MIRGIGRWWFFVFYNDSGLEKIKHRLHRLHRLIWEGRTGGRLTGYEVMKGRCKGESRKTENEGLSRDVMHHVSVGNRKSKYRKSKIENRISNHKFGNGERFCKSDGGPGFPFRGSRGERGEEGAWKKKGER